MLLATLAAGLLGNMLTGNGINRPGEEIIRAGYVSKISWIKNLQFNKKFLIPPHPFTNLEVEKYYQNGPKFNGVYSRDNLTIKIKEGAYVMELTGLLCMHWIIMLLILIVLVFQKKSKNLLVIKTHKQIFQNVSIWFSCVWIFLY